MASDSKNKKDKNFQQSSPLKFVTPSDLEKVPVIPLRNTVLFPGLTLPIAVTEKQLIPVCKESVSKHKIMACFTLKNSDATGRYRKDYYDYGTIIEVTEFIDDPNDGPGIVAHVLNVVKISRSKFEDGIMYFKLDYINELLPEYEDEIFQKCYKYVKEQYLEMLRVLNSNTEPIVKMLESINNPLVEISFMCLNSPLDNDQKIFLLKKKEVASRAIELAALLSDSIPELEVKKEIHERTTANINDQQRENFLRNQIQIIREELGDTDEEDIQHLLNESSKKKWGADVQAQFDREIRKMQRFNPSTPEYGILFSYLETMLTLPWDELTQDNSSLKDVECQLDEDHFGLRDVKERILEHIAVQKQRQDLKTPIICLVGPPGVGKTSLGKSIATALNRGYARVSLGGVHDEAEIRGHRKTYIGAMPGRIIGALKRMEGNNPVFVLDEIDKIDRDIKGDPSSALLELLDPEQNNKFHDNYLDIDYDLSQVMFIATANDISTVSKPLLDRMEIIRVDGYSPEEKIEIAKRHLIPKVLRDTGFEENEIELSQEAIETIITGYTRESGVRSLEKRISKIMRKIALLKARGKDYPKKVESENVKELLGTEDIIMDSYEGNAQAGVVTGLAWTSVGGEILYVETSLNKSKTPQLTLTGNLGNVMKESATLALQYLKANSALLGIDEEVFSSYNVHIHVPEGAVPKDGPSAGITIATSIASAFTRRKIMPELAMTGEITLRGKVLPVGGIKEKILAAKRAGITQIILSQKNRKDIESIDQDYLKGVSFHYVDNVSDVFNIALTDDLDLSLPERTVLKNNEIKPD